MAVGGWRLGVGSRALLPPGTNCANCRPAGVCCARGCACCMCPGPAMCSWGAHMRREGGAGAPAAQQARQPDSQWCGYATSPLPYGTPPTTAANRVACLPYVLEGPAVLVHESVVDGGQHVIALGDLEALRLRQHVPHVLACGSCAQSMLVAHASHRMHAPHYAQPASQFSVVAAGAADLPKDAVACMLAAWPCFQACVQASCMHRHDDMHAGVRSARRANNVAMHASFDKWRHPRVRARTHAFMCMYVCICARTCPKTVCFSSRLSSSSPVVM